MRALVIERFKILSDELGHKIDFRAMEAANLGERIKSYDAMLQRQYNFTKAEAAEIMDKAMQAEASPYRTHRRRGRAIFR